VIRDPDQQIRARYRRAIHRLIINHQIPDGFGLRHTGRDRGDLTIRLTALPDDPRQPDPPPRVSVPDTMDEVTPAVRALGEGERLAVTPDALNRALRITQAIADECTVRGWAFAPSPNGDRAFRITVQPTRGRGLCRPSRQACGQPMTRRLRWRCPPSG
jgi:hypothetical protein